MSYKNIEELYNVIDMLSKHKGELLEKQKEQLDVGDDDTETYKRILEIESEEIKYEDKLIELQRQQTYSLKESLKTRLDRLDELIES